MNFTTPACAALACALAALTAAPAHARARRPAHGLTLTALLARHLKASGTPTALKDKSPSKTVYALDAAGMDGTLTEYDAPPHKMRVEMSLGPLKQVSADDGTVAWELDPSGHVRTLSGAELSENRAQAGFSLESYDPLKSKGKVTLRPKREAGTGDYIIDMIPNGGALQTAYLNPKTYLIDKIVASKAGVNGTVAIRSYRKIAGAMVPENLAITYVGLPIEIQAHLVSVDPLPSVPPDLFTPPQAAKEFEILTPGARSATVPFENADNEIVIALRINGKTRRFLLDSGAGSTFITGGAAQEIGLTTQGDIPAVGYGGTAAAGIASHTTLEIPDAVRLSGQNVVVIKDPTITQGLHDRGGLDGAIGYDLFSRFVVTVDYQKKTLTLTDPALAGKPAPPDVRLPIRLDNRTPVVRASLDGHSSGAFFIDTGDSGAVHLFQRYAHANGLEPQANDPTAQRITGYGVGGAVTQIVTRGHRLALGPVTLTDVPASVVGGAGVTAALDEAGGIGNLALQKFLAVFDYPHQEIRLYKQPGFRPQVGQRAAARRRAFCPASAQRSDLTLEQLQEKHLAALGGQAAVEAIRNTRVSAKIATGGLTGTVRTIYAAPDKEYEEDTIGILHVTQGCDGAAAWRRDSNGNIRPLGGDELKTQRNQLFFDTNAYVLPGRAKGQITLRPEREAGTGNYQMDVLPEGGKPSTLFFDPKTFLIVKEQHRDDNITVTTTYSDYRAVNGVQFPFRQHTTNGSARYDIDLTVSSIENNVTLPPDQFAQPTDTTHAEFVTPGATSATIPFDYSDGEIAIPFKINGQTQRVFLDSGASGIALSKRTADALHLPQGGYLEARGYGGSTDLTPVKIQTLEVPGAIRMTDVAAVAIPLPPSLDRYLAKPIAGFVGYDLLSHFVVRIDYAKRQVTFIAPTAFQPSEKDGKPLPIELDDDVPTLTAQLDALPPSRFLVDTGDEASLRLYGPFITKYGLAMKYPKGIRTTGGGIGGASEARLTRIGSFTVAGVQITGIPADFSLDPKGGASELNAGAIGSSLLSRFVVTFDYPHGRLYLAPQPDATRPFDTRTTGITLARTADGKRWLVAGMTPASPALKAGLKVYDEILSIDGQPVSKASQSQIARMLSPKSGKETHTLVVEGLSGKSHPIQVGLYDPLQ